MPKKRAKKSRKSINDRFFLFCYKKERQFRGFISELLKKPFPPILERLFLVFEILFASIPANVMGAQDVNPTIHANLEALNPAVTAIHLSLNAVDHPDRFHPSLVTMVSNEGQREAKNLDVLADLPEPLLREPRIKRKIMVTFYSSDPWQTDSTPFITANGEHVRDGIAAANFLPFGTSIRLPELYGDKIFTIEDRMNERFDNRIDVWVATREEARARGIAYTTVEVY